MKTITLRDKQLLKKAKQTLLGNIVENPKNGWSGRCIIPSFDTYTGIWNWDSAFHAMTTSLFDKNLAYNHFHAFYKMQGEDGMFPDAMIMSNDNFSIADRGSKPPVFPWAFVQVYKRNPDKKELKLAYEKFKNNETFWSQKRCYKGLFHYDCCDREKDWEQISKWESGWDTSPRFDTGCSTLWCVDLNCFMILYYESLEYMAKKLEIQIDAQKWNAKRKELKKHIKESLWNNETKCFYDFDFSTNKFVKVLTPSSLMPLFAKIATPKQAYFMSQKVKESLYPGMPSVSYQDKSYTQTDFWRGPTWLNISYFAAIGLKNYKYNDLFIDITNCVLDWCYNEKLIHEYYDSKTGKGINGIEVSRAPFYNTQTDTTGVDGSFEIYGNTWPEKEFQIELKDIDPEKDGSYASKIETVNLKQVKKGSGSWYSGAFEAEGVILKMDEDTKE